MMKKYFGPILLLTASACLLSCSSTNLMSLSVTEPAPVFVNHKGTTIGVINRSVPSEKQNKVLDAIDKVLSAEGMNLDKEGANQALLGLQNELQKTQDYADARILDVPNLKAPGLSVFPAPLTWETVNEIGKKNNINVLFELSFFDTDSKLDIKTEPTTIPNAFGIKIPAIQTRANVTTLVKTGWRIYDLRSQSIIDELSGNKQVSLSGSGLNPVNAFEAIIGRKEAVLQISNKGGMEYATRILPFRIRVSRDYFVRGTDNFKMARRRAQTGNWDGAAELWSREVNNPNWKVAGRACYNMAIINEINGNLDAAIDWASKSYSDYGNRLALRYLNVLKNRNYKNQILEAQNQQ